MQDWWKEASANVVPYLNITASVPRRGEPVEDAPDQGLMMKKGGRGFPYCTIMNANGDVIWEVRPTSKDAFMEGLKNAKVLQAWMVKAKKDPKDKVVAATVALMSALGCQQRQAPSADELEGYAKVEGVDKAVLTKFKAWQTNTKLMGYLRRRDGAEKIYEMFMATGKSPEGFSYPEAFYFYAARGAVEAEDAKRANAALKLLEPIVAKMKGRRAAGLKGAIKQLKEQLAELDGDEEGKDGGK